MMTTATSDPPLSVHHDTEALREQKRHEIRISRKYRDDVAFRLFFEMVWGIGAWLGVIALALGGWLPYWVACLLNGWIAYLLYMPLHEATHGNISGAHAKWAWLDDLAGHVSSIPLWFGFSSHRISHMRHHAYANDPERDPDYFLAGSWRDLFVKNGILAVLQTIVPVMTLYPRSLNWLPLMLRQIAYVSRMQRPADEVTYEERFIRCCAAVFVALSLSGFFVEALVLWWLPSRIGMGLMTFLFAWLPHHPHEERSRYRDTRITLFPGSRLLIRGQDRHLLHHMFPRVPHYRLPALFQALRSDLEAHGARIEGPLAGPGAPKIRMQ